MLGMRYMLCYLWLRSRTFDMIHPGLKITTGPGVEICLTYPEDRERHLKKNLKVDYGIGLVVEVFFNACDFCFQGTWRHADLSRQHVARCLGLYLADKFEQLMTDLLY